MQAGHLAFLKDWFETIGALGNPPWEDLRFQVIGLLRCALPAGREFAEFFAIPGRDVRLPASPAATVKWMAIETGIRPSEGAFLTCGRILRDYESKRRQLLRKIVERLLTLTGQRQPEGDTLAFAILDRRLVVIRPSEVPGIEVELEALASVRDSILSELRIVTRR